MAPFTDNFDSYNNGDLNGQGSWTGDADFDVQGTTVKAGAKAVLIASTAGTDERIQKQGTSRADGGFRIWFRKEGYANESGQAIRLGEGGTIKAEVVIITSNGSVGTVRFESGAQVIGNYTPDTYQYIDIEWRDSDKSYRARFNDGTWATWGTIGTAWTTGLDTIEIQSNQTSGNDFFFDEIEELPFSSSSSSTSSSSSSFSSSSSSSSSSSFSSSSSSSSFSSSSSSFSSSSFSSSSSSFSSSSSSSPSVYSSNWGIAWGEENPDADETAESWATWSDGAGGSPTIIGDADWGKLQLGNGYVAHSPVHYFGDLSSATTITKDKYGSGFGSFNVYYRESDTPFSQDDVSPAWTEYSGGMIYLTKTYRQIKLEGE